MADWLTLTAFSCFLWMSSPVTAVREVNMCSGQTANALSAYIRLTNTSATNSYCQCTIVKRTSLGSGAFQLTLTAEQVDATELDDVCVTAFALTTLTELASQCFENGTSQTLTIVASHEGNMKLTFQGVQSSSPPGGSTFSLKIKATSGTADIICDNTPPPTTAAVETTAAEETTTLPITPVAEKTTTLPITAGAEKTTTLPITAGAEKTTTLPITAGAEKTTTLPITAGAEKTTTLPITAAPIITTSSTNNNSKALAQPGAQTSSSSSVSTPVIVLGTLGAIAFCLLVTAAILIAVHAVKGRTKVRPIQVAEAEE